MCENCENYLNVVDTEIVICGECGQSYMMLDSKFHECRLKKNEKGDIVAFIEGKPLELNFEEREVIKSLKIVRRAMSCDGEGSFIRVAMPFPGTEALIFQ